MQVKTFALVIDFHFPFPSKVGKRHSTERGNTQRSMLVETPASRRLPVTQRKKKMFSSGASAPTLSRVFFPIFIHVGDAVIQGGIGELLDIPKDLLVIGVVEVG